MRKERNLNDLNVRYITNLNLIYERILETNEEIINAKVCTLQNYKYLNKGFLIKNTNFV